VIPGRNIHLRYTSENQSGCNLSVNRLASVSQFGPCGAKMLSQEDKDTNTCGCLAAGEAHVVLGVGVSWGCPGCHKSSTCHVPSSVS